MSPLFASSDVWEGYLLQPFPQWLCMPIFTQPAPTILTDLATNEQEIQNWGENDRRKGLDGSMMCLKYSFLRTLD